MTCRTCRYYLPNEPGCLKCNPNFPAQEQEQLKNGLVGKCPDWTTPEPRPEFGETR